MNRFFVTILSFVLCAGAFAIPANRTPFTVYQSDSTALTVMLVGDEFCHYLATLDGTPVVEDGDGFYRLAPEMKATLNEMWATKSRQRNAQRMERSALAKSRRANEDVEPAYIGDKKGIVILVNFSNLSMKVNDPNKSFYNQFNQEKYNQNGNIGSVHDYFYDQSYGMLNLTFDVYGPVTVGNEYSYYGENDAYGEDKHVTALTREACQLANYQYDIDWSKYDWDGDGEVDQVFIIYAGYGEAYGAPSNTIWPHEWSLSGAGETPLWFGDTKVNVYAMSCELSGTSGSSIDCIGTACHEFSHCLGLPDLYDTGYNGGYVMGYWDLMDMGNSNGLVRTGSAPAGFSAFERWYAGWLTPTELKEPCSVYDMPALQNEPVAYIIYNDGNPNEFYMLENRQNKKWFAYVGNSTNCHGMLAIHINYDAQKWAYNEVNTDVSEQRMTIIPAGKKYGTLVTSGEYKFYQTTTDQLRSQLFPGNKNVTELTNESHFFYGGQLQNANIDDTYYMNKPITDIAETEDGRISFKFMGGGADAIDGIDWNNDGGQEEFFTLNGMKIDSPKVAGIYIVRKNGETRKIYVK